MKKLIVTKTIQFLFILLFIAGFKSLFGAENALIGVTVIIATLMYLERDLTANPWKSFFFLLGINVLQGMFGFLSAINMWLGIPLNLISMFIVGYFFTFNLRKPIYIAFGLQYIFIITTPIAMSDLPLRLLALASGAAIVMISQIVVNKNKVTKSGTKNILIICDQLMAKVHAIKHQNDYSEMNHSIESSIKELRKIIYCKRIDGYYLSNEGRLILKISACLEKLNLLLNRLEDQKQIYEVLDTMSQELQIVKQYIEKGVVPTNHLNSLRSVDNHTLYMTEVVNTFEFIFDLLNDLYSASQQDLRHVEKLVDIPTTFTYSYDHFINFNKHSVRFTYAVRLAIIITIAAFISDYFTLENGRWIIFTVFSVTQPYMEHARYRFSRRMIGTLIGAVLFIVLFSIFTDVTSRSLIISIAGYLIGYAVTYRNISIIVTVVALGNAALVSDVQIVTFDRILYVLLGIIIGMIANRFIFPHSIQKGTTSLVRMYKDVSKNLIEEVYTFFKTKSNAHSINHLFAVSSFIEDRILLNIETLEWKDSQQFLEKQRTIHNAIYELFLRTQKNKVNDSTVQLILQDMNQIIESSNEGLDKLIKKIKEDTRKVLRMDDRIILNDIINIFEHLKKNEQFFVELMPKKL